MSESSIGIDLRVARVAAAALRGKRLADPVVRPTECSDSEALIDQLTTLVELVGGIYRGATGAAGVLGHTILGLDLAGAVPRPMGFPQPGSLEFVASGHALDRLAAVAGRVDPNSELARLRAQRKPVLSAAVVK